MKKILDYVEFLNMRLNILIELSATPDPNKMLYVSNALISVSDYIFPPSEIQPLIDQTNPGNNIKDIVAILQSSAVFVTANHCSALNASLPQVDVRFNKDSYLFEIPSLKFKVNIRDYTHAKIIEKSKKIITKISM